jgi:HSP20 family protein
MDELIPEDQQQQQQENDQWRPPGRHWSVRGGADAERHRGILARMHDRQLGRVGLPVRKRPGRPCWIYRAGLDQDARLLADWHPASRLVVADRCSGAARDGLPHAVRLTAAAVFAGVDARRRRLLAGAVQGRELKRCIESAMTDFRFSCPIIKEHQMNTDPKKWNPFKFLRGSGRSPDADSPQSPPASEPSRVGWSDIPRLFSRDPWRAMEDFFHDPFAARGALERWFGDFSSSRFQPRIDVVDEGKILRVTVELPGMEREELNVSVEDGALVLRGDKKQDVHGEEDGCYRLERAYGAFTRTIPMPENADPDHALAKFDKGVLTLTVPKQEPPRSASRMIDIG